MEKDEILSGVIVEILSQFKRIGEQLAQEYSGKLGNSWAIPYLIGQLESFNPKGLEGENINFAKGEEASLEQLARDAIETKVKSSPAYSVAIRLAGGLPEGEIYSAAGKADQLKLMLYERGDKEASALMEKSSGYGAVPELVGANFSGSRAFASADQHRAHAEQFTGLFLEIVNDLAVIAEWFGAKTRKRVVGSKIKEKVNPMVQGALKIDAVPDWDSLPKDLKVIGDAIAEAYLKFEEGLMEKRYS